MTCARVATGPVLQAAIEAVGMPKQAVGGVFGFGHDDALRMGIRATSEVAHQAVTSQARK